MFFLVAFRRSDFRSCDLFQLGGKLIFYPPFSKGFEPLYIPKAVHVKGPLK